MPNMGEKRKRRPAGDAVLRARCPAKLATLAVSGPQLDIRKAGPETGPAFRDQIPTLAIACARTGTLVLLRPAMFSRESPTM